MLLYDLYSTSVQLNSRMIKVYIRNSKRALRGGGARVIAIRNRKKLGQLLYLLHRFIGQPSKFVSLWTDIILAYAAACIDKPKGSVILAAYQGTRRTPN